ncbi:MAG: trehalase-like domain-containing protein, partial [Planctomycetota bacterium JB042]
MALAIIGNCSYSALLEDGAVRWLCWPRMDSSFVFGSLLDEDRGGEFRVVPNGPHEVVQDYLENTNVLRTVFRAEDGVFEVVDFAPRFSQHERYYKPSMLMRLLRPL